jgi:uncharacterized protein YbjQ (UPF0145 family)
LHYWSIEEREGHYSNYPEVTFEEEELDNVERFEFVTGSAVISVDYFKRFIAGLRSIFGGRVRTYESLVDRARREAILRCKEQAPDAHIIHNLRIETSSIGQSANQRGTIGSIEALAYGTAIWIRQ